MKKAVAVAPKAIRNKEDAARAVVRQAGALGSTDNMTVVVHLAAGAVAAADDGVLLASAPAAAWGLLAPVRASPDRRARRSPARGPADAAGAARRDRRRPGDRGLRRPRPRGAGRPAAAARPRRRPVRHARLPRRLDPGLVRLHAAGARAADARRSP